MGRITDLPDGPVMPAYQSSGALSNASGSTSHERPALGDRKISQTTAMSRELQGILARENSHVESSEPVSPHQTKLREWMGAQQLALSHSVTHQVNKSVGQAAHVLERLTRGAAALQAEQAGQLKRVGDWLHAQSGEAAQSWLRTVGRLNQLASRSDQTSVTLTFLVLRALNDEEPSCEDAIAYLENMLARDPDAVIQMMPQLADSLMYFEERHGGLIPPHALSRPTRVRSESEEELAAIGAALLAEAPAAALDGLPVAEGHVELAVAARGAGGQAAYPHALEAWILNECNRSRHFKLRWLWCLQATGGVAAERLLASVQSLSLYQCGLPEQNFIDALLELSRRLVAVPREHRQAMLQRALGAVNEQLADTLWLPIAPIPERHHRVVRMLPNESIVLSTKARVPYLLICETLPVDETWDAAPGRMTDYGRQLSDTGAEDNDYALQGEEGQGVSEVEVVPYNASYAYEISATGGAYGLSLYDGLDFSAGASAGGGGVAAAASLSASLGGPLSPLRWSVGRHAATVGSTTGPGSFVNLTNLIQTQLPLAWCARQPRTASTLSKKVHVDDIVQPSKHPSRVASPKAPARLNGAGGSGSASRALSATPELLASAAGGQVEGEDVSLAQQTVPPLPIAASGKEGAVTATERLANRLRIFGETWAERERRVAASSQYGNLRGWSLLPVIVKANDDLRQEQFAVQLINVVQKCYDDAGLPLQLRTALIVATTPDGGLVQVVTGAISLDSVKKRLGGGTLSDVFRLVYGAPGSKAHQRALTLFTESCAAWAVVSFLLQIKDRHNGNILLHQEGYIVHIDFGFLISNSPGGNIGFESAPFKLTHEYVELMGGVDSGNFRLFRSLFVQGYLAARRRDAKIMQLVEMTRTGVGRYLPCFMGGELAVEAMRHRFLPGKTKREAASYAAKLVQSSIGHWRTTCYDEYQSCVQGIRV